MQVCQFGSPSADAAGGCAIITAVPSSVAVRQVKWRIYAIPESTFDLSSPVCIAGFTRLNESG
jgi:hypothetical protein